MDTSGLLDKRNLDLWNKLRVIHEIEIRKENRSDYLAFSKSGKTIISVPYDNLNEASFTHELLHVDLRTKQIFISGCLTLSTKDDIVLSKIFSADLLDHISNCLDHIKMLPKFLELGYDKHEFISDYSVDKLTEEEIAALKEYIITISEFEKKYNAKAIDFFIGKYFAVNACPNDSINYEIKLNELKKLDADLFHVLDTFLIDWKNFNCNDKDSITDNYRSLALDFIENIEKWTNGKAIN